jgi:P27 family predicted phage terminase small subunit
VLRGRKPRPAAGRPEERAPRPPPELDAVARREWRRVAGALHARGALGEVDRGSLAAYCQLYSRWVGAEKALAAMAKLDPVTGGLMIRTKNGNAIQNPLVGIANSAAAAMVRYAAEFGMTPSARGRVAADGEPARLGKKEQAAAEARTAGDGTDLGRGPEDPLSWCTACPDWQDRILQGRSLVPDLPLFADEAARALRVFKRLRLADVAGTPTLGEAGAPWFFAIVAALFGSYDRAAAMRTIQEIFLLVPKKNAKTSYSAALIVTGAILTLPRSTLTDAPGRARNTRY